MSLSCFLCHWQVHGSDAEAASKQLSWSQMPTLVLEAAKMPILWYFAVAGFSCEHFAEPGSEHCTVYQMALSCLLHVPAAAATWWLTMPCTMPLTMPLRHTRTMLRAHPFVTA
jgi:hypothetical protein